MIRTATRRGIAVVWGRGLSNSLTAQNLVHSRLVYRFSMNNFEGVLWKKDPEGQLGCNPQGSVNLTETRRIQTSLTPSKTSRSQTQRSLSPRKLRDRGTTHSRVSRSTSRRKRRHSSNQRSKRSGNGTCLGICWVPRCWLSGGSEKDMRLTLCTR